MRETIQYKISQQGVRWEDTPVTAVTVMNEGASYQQAVEEATRWAKHLASMNGAEVRWNFLGSEQGHYVEVPVER